MAVETRKTSRYWYGRWQEKGIRKCKRLGILVIGDPGSDEFEASRDAAEKELRTLVEDARLQHRPEDVVQRLNEVKFGRRVGSIPLSHLAEEWEALPRKRKLSQGRLRYGRAVIARFISYLQDGHPSIRELAAITTDIAEAFMATEEARKLRPASYNSELSLLRSTFGHLRVKAGMLANPFEGNLVFKESDTISRVPFTLAELEHLFETAKAKDPEIHDLIVVGACTALRRGDACCLKWADVDLPANRIRVKTRKTGASVPIPVFPRLHAVLRARPRSGKYVFPGLATAYEEESWVVNNRLRAVFIAAGFARVNQKDEAALRMPVTIEAEIPDDGSLRKTVLARIDAMTAEEVSPRVKAAMRDAYDLYSSGTTLPDIAKQLGIGRGTASNYFARIEKAVGHPIVRKEIAFIRKREALARLPAAEDDAGRHSDEGRVRVNSRGFHALRATFATQALASGVPVEVVKLVTGHSLTETVLRHYFNPDEQTVFAKMQQAMPQALTLHEGKTLREEQEATINRLKSRLTKEERAALLTLAERVTT